MLTLEVFKSKMTLKFFLEMMIQIRLTVGYKEWRI